MKLNLNFYKEDVFYNKLASEDSIIEQYISRYNEDEYEKIIEKNNDLETLSILSEIRKNIISWYPLDKEKNILEIGAGLGEITGELCKKVNRVVSVEFSKSRGEAIAKRHSDKENLEVIIGNLKDIKFNEKFDYITLIGVLEYAPEIYVAEKPFLELLKYVQSLLKENGKILIATNNKFGMRNWAVTEINEKKLGHNAVSTSKKYNESQLLSKNEIEKLLQEANLKTSKFYYPLPDYRFTNVIFTDEFMPDKNNLHRNISVFYDDEILSFNENDGYLQLITEDKQLFKTFANSFFIETSSNHLEQNNIKYISFWNNRKRKYRLKTIIQGNKVYKYPANELAKKHIETIKKNIEILKENNINTLDEYDDERIISNYIENGKSYDKIIIEEYKKNGEERLIELINDFFNKTVKKMKDTNANNNVFEQYNIKYSKEDIEGLHFIKKGLWDMNFQNCFLIDGDFYIYDQEWIESNVPIEFIIYRSILIFNELNQNIDRNEIYRKLGIQKYLKIFNELEKKMSNEIMDDKMISIYNKPVKNVVGLIMENCRLQDEKIKIEKELEEKLEIEQQQNKENKELISKLNNEIEIIMNSRSWKMTEPLRKMKKYLK